MIVDISHWPFRFICTCLMNLKHLACTHIYIYMFINSVCASAMVLELNIKLLEVFRYGVMDYHEDFLGPQQQPIRRSESSLDYAGDNVHREGMGKCTCSSLITLTILQETDVTSLAPNLCTPRFFRGLMISKTPPLRQRQAGSRSAVQ